MPTVTWETTHRRTLQVVEEEQAAAAAARLRWARAPTELGPPTRPSQLNNNKGSQIHFWIIDYKTQREGIGREWGEEACGKRKE